MKPKNQLQKAKIKRKLQNLAYNRRAKVFYPIRCEEKETKTRKVILPPQDIKTNDIEFT